MSFNTISDDVHKSSGTNSQCEPFMLKWLKTEKYTRKRI